MIINGIEVKLQEVYRATCNGCVFNNYGNCTLDNPHCSCYSIYVKTNK